MAQPGHIAESAIVRSAGDGASSALHGGSAGASSGGPADFPSEAPAGSPTRLLVRHDDRVIVDMPMHSARYDASGDLSSACGSVAWNAEPGWPEPGASSPYYALMSGHVRCGRELYTLDALRDVVPGDTMTVAYSSGEEAEFRALQGAETIAKAELNADPARYRGDVPDSVVRLSTCDPESAPRPDGHLSQNIWTLWRRVG
ncbi:sortase family protein [Nigerium massiliense]|uniref:hypothetical protein n=1 Tax=Nigerium massiliense TaxID=1522317 RepID=UPI0011CBE5E9|nr:hypothetical protein [Nigerium massiliense]